MRVALVTESFLPDVNGVANSCLRVVEHLGHRGHDVLTVAPGRGPTSYAGAEVVRTPAAPLPLCRGFGVGVPTARLEPALRWFRPDVVHLASPVALGAHAASLTRRLGLPTLGVYQTDLAGFAQQYRLRPAVPMIRRWIARIHRMVDLTLAPSRSAVAELRALRVPNVRRWGRGVDGERFNPSHRSERLRRRLLGSDAELVVGYVGRLAREKRLELLTALAGIPGMRLVIVGDGPARSQLRAVLPHAVFLGELHGRPLPEAFASLDVFVHTGAAETFCQAAQEALASGVPVVAPAAGGLTDVVRHGDNGLLWPPSSPASFRRHVAELCRRDDLRRRLASNARPSVVERRWSVLGDELLTHYSVVTRGRQGHARRLRSVA